MKLGYNKLLGASQMCLPKPGLLITGDVYGLNMDLGPKNWEKLFLITGSSLYPSSL